MSAATAWVRVGADLTARPPPPKFYNPGPGATCWLHVCALVKGFVTFPLYCHQADNYTTSDLALVMRGRMVTTYSSQPAFAYTC